MTAETAYHVIKALPVDEIPRLYKMLGVDQPKARAYKKRKPLISDAQATEYLLKKLKK
jgi:hypothetical protein